MARTSRLLILGFALALNGAALAVVHAGMGQISDREKLALHQPARVVVTGQRSEPPILAVQNCPAPKVL